MIPGLYELGSSMKHLDSKVGKWRKRLTVDTISLASVVTRSLVLPTESLQHPVAAASQMAISRGASYECGTGHHSSKLALSLVLQLSQGFHASSSVLSVKSAAFSCL